MKNLYFIIFTFFSLILVAQEVTIVSPANGYAVEEEIVEKDERIVSFASDIIIAENAEVTVKETIRAYATGNEIKRGLFRALPMVRNINGRKEKITYKMISVKKEGSAEPYHTEIMNGVFNIYIGSKDIILSPGLYTYEITYKTEDQIGHFKGYDEFYWNVNGTDWSFPIENIEATLTLPPGADIIQNSCYTGAYDSINSNCWSDQLSPTKIYFNARDLKRRENLTIAVGFKAGVLKEPSAFVKWLKRNWPSLFLVLAGFYMLYWFYDNWNKYGRDPEKPIIIPYFKAPKNLSPGSLGYIDKGKFDVTQVTANLVDLAVKGYVNIDEVKDEKKKALFSKSYDIRKLDKKREDLQDDQVVLLNKIFLKGTLVSISGAYSSKVKNAVIDLEKVLTRITKSFTENTSNSHLAYKGLKIIILIFISALVISAVLTQSGGSLIIAVFVLVFDGALIYFLLYLWDEKSRGTFYVVLIVTSPFLIPIFFLAFGSVENLTSFESDSFKFLVVGMISLFVFRYLINKPSVEKVKMEAEIAGFKMYLGTAEENLLKFHNPPEMTTAVYEKFLPYAMVFGVEGIWGKRFRDKLLDTLHAENPYEVQRQFSHSFASSFSRSLAATTVSPVSHSSSSSSSRSSGSSSSSRSSRSSSYSGGSSSSGSSGGGSSGGGGGGGGGGGW